MNRDNRKLICLLFILSIIVAYITGRFSYHIATLGLSENERMLEVRRRDLPKLYRRAKFVENISSNFVREWKKAKTIDEQSSLWKRWTGNPLPSEPWWQNIRPHDPNDPAMQLSPTADELPRLKEQGWETKKGEPLPLTPIGVSYGIEERGIKAEEEHLRRRRSQVPVTLILGTIIGGGTVWVLYAATRWGAWLVFVWIKRGFQEDKTKGEQKNNESDLVDKVETKNPNQKGDDNDN